MIDDVDIDPTEALAEAMYDAWCAEFHPEWVGGFSELDESDTEGWLNVAERLRQFAEDDT
jgi:hypothetical protein